ncbi:hypothetical protein Q8F55_000546 [Vanrija albida]|uniref:Transmembrane protein n=1 Tax=Vanrija albida TaxID=181172 RepID=A0ABR3QDM4_9TREE
MASYLLALCLPLAAAVPVSIRQEASGTVAVVDASPIPIPVPILPDPPAANGTDAAPTISTASPLPSRSHSVGLAVGLGALLVAILGVWYLVRKRNAQDQDQRKPYRPYADSDSSPSASPELKAAVLEKARAAPSPVPARTGPLLISGPTRLPPTAFVSPSTRSLPHPDAIEEIRSVSDEPARTKKHSRAQSMMSTMSFGSLRWMGAAVDSDSVPSPVAPHTFSPADSAVSVSAVPSVTVSAPAEEVAVVEKKPKKRAHVHAHAPAGHAERPPSHDSASKRRRWWRR